jgi:hypothetical protein
MRAFFLIIIIFSCLFSVISAKADTEQQKIFSTTDELYDAILQDNLNFITSKTYTTNIDFNSINADTIMENARSKGSIIGACLYAVQYSSSVPGNISFKFSYYMDKYEYGQVLSCAEQMAKALDGKGEYDKVRYVHDYIITHCDYDMLSNGPYNCLFNRHACCNGYALAFQCIMEKAGIKCKYVTGGDHAWNLVYVNGFWFNIDLTWDDLGGENISYEYFLKCNRDWRKHASAGSTASFSYTGEEAYDDNVDITKMKYISVLSNVGKYLIVIGGTIVILILIIIKNRKQGTI